MPRGKLTCPICHGKGTLTEDAKQYEFVTRDPQTSKCLICNGTGFLGIFASLPDGTPARSLAKQTQPKLRYSPGGLTSTLKRRGLSPEEHGADHANSPGDHDADHADPSPARLLPPLPAPLSLAPDHPLYLDTFRFIRGYELRHGSWDLEHELAFSSALEYCLATIDSMIPDPSREVKHG